MQSLASMLEERDLVKITTAELAKRSEISEAAIYKHFPSKRKIYEELVSFFEESIFTRIKSIKEESKPEDVPGQLISLILKLYFLQQLDLIMYLCLQGLLFLH